MLVRKYVDWNDTAAILADKRSAGVTPEVNLRTPLHACNEAHKNAKGSILALKPRADIARSQKTGVSVAPQKGLMFSKFF